MQSVYFHETEILSPRNHFGDFSAEKLGLNEDQFKALKLVLRVLDTVFRFADADHFHGNSRNSVCAHSIAMAEKIDKLFQPICNKNGIDKVNFMAVEAARQAALLSALVHDAGETIIEFSTVDGRVIGQETLSNEDRHAMERDIASIVFNLAVEAVKNNDENILVNEIRIARDLIKSGKSQLEVVKNFIKELKPKNLKKDVSVLMNAFNRAENREDLMGVLVKAIDSMDGNKFLVDNGINLPDRPTSIVNHVISKAHALKETLAKFKKLIDSTMDSLTENARNFAKAHGLNPDTIAVLNNN